MWDRLPRDLSFGPRALFDRGRELRAYIAGGRNDAIDQAILQGLGRSQDVIAVDIALDPLQRLARGLGNNLVQRVPHAQDLFGVNLDIGGLSRQAAQGRLMNPYARVRQTVALSLGAAGEQHGRHRGRLPDTVRYDVRLHHAHRVQDRQARGDRAAGRIDVNGDVFLRIFRG